MKQVVLQKDEKRIIGVLMGDHGSYSELKTKNLDKRSFAGAQDDNSDTAGKKLDIVLAGEGSEVEVVGLVLGNKSDEKSLEVYITHKAPNTKSNVNVRAVLKNQSKFDFRGNVKIEKGAKGSNAYLRSDALLFGDAKMGDDTPALEILERDVKAGHAATVGKVDEQMLFYLMSRGLSRKSAESLLIKGFVSPVMERIRNREEIV